MTMLNNHPQQRTADGRSFHDQPIRGSWPKRRVIWSCEAERGPLLTRYFLIQTRWFAVYLHHLQASDTDRAHHDHPWAFISVLLSSGYYEWTPNRHPEQPGLMRLATIRTWKPRFSVLYRPAEWQHRLELVKPTWTLVLRFRRRREWGFITRSGWLGWREYGKRWCD